MLRNRPSPHEEEIVLAAGVPEPVTVPGPQDSGLLRVIYTVLAYDEAKVSGAALQDVTAVIRPRDHTNYMGGDTQHSFYGQPVANGSARNAIYLAFSLNKGEDLELSLLSPAGGTIRITVHRWLVFNEQGSFPQLRAPGGFAIAGKV